MIVITWQVGQKHKPSELEDQSINNKKEERKKTQKFGVSSDNDRSSWFEVLLKEGSFKHFFRFMIHENET